ncbi:hypothetical protein DSC45_22545 [Streptomyces sp. YIM 130001]|nr:hypothetical protein DSC45_22545 [Streptomyces sp. YIM 130001]
MGGVGERGRGGGRSVGPRAAWIRSWAGESVAVGADRGASRGPIGGGRGRSGADREPIGGGQGRIGGRSGAHRWRSEADREPVGSPPVAVRGGSGTDREPTGGGQRRIGNRSGADRWRSEADREPIGSRPVAVRGGSGTDRARAVYIRHERTDERPDELGRLDEPRDRARHDGGVALRDGRLRRATEPAYEAKSRAGAGIRVLEAAGAWCGRRLPQAGCAAPPGPARCFPVGALTAPPPRGRGRGRGRSEGCGARPVGRTGPDRAR